MFLPVTEQCLCNYSNEQFNDGMNYSHSCSYFSFGRCLPGVVLCDSIGVFGLGGGGETCLYVIGIQVREN